MSPANEALCFNVLQIWSKKVETESKLVTEMKCVAMAAKSFCHEGGLVIVCHGAIVFPPIITW